MKQVGARGASELSLRPQFLEPRYRWRQAALGSGTTDNQGPPASSVENKRTRMFTSHIHNGPSQKPSQQHSECVNCGARPRRMLESWDEESAPGVQQGPRPLTGAEGHPRALRDLVYPSRTQPERTSAALRGDSILGAECPKGLLVFQAPHSGAPFVSKARSRVHYCKSANVSPEEEEGKWEDEDREARAGGTFCCCSFAGDLPLHFKMGKEERPHCAG